MVFRETTDEATAAAAAITPPDRLLDAVQDPEEEEDEGDRDLDDEVPTYDHSTNPIFPSPRRRIHEAVPLTQFHQDISASKFRLMVQNL